MRSDLVSDYNRLELLDEYMNLQERFTMQLEKGQQRQINLSRAKMNLRNVLPDRNTSTTASVAGRTNVRCVKQPTGRNGYLNHNTDFPSKLLYY